MNLSTSNRDRKRNLPFVYLGTNFPRCMRAKNRKQRGTDLRAVTWLTRTWKRIPRDPLLS